MGGVGSGNYDLRYDKRDDTSKYSRLDSFEIRKGIQILRQRNHESFDSILNWRSGNKMSCTLYLNRIELSYRVRRGEENINIKDVLYLDAVPNNYGGQDRVYFLCPECGCRSRYLYLILSCFKCRKCAELNYLSQQTTKGCSSMARNRIYGFVRDKFRESFADNTPSVIAQYKPLCPKGMHSTTYERLLLQLRGLQKDYVSKYCEERRKQSELLRQSREWLIEDSMRRDRESKHQS